MRSGQVRSGQVKRSGQVSLACNLYQGRWECPAQKPIFRSGQVRSGQVKRSNKASLACNVYQVIMTMVLDVLHNHQSSGSVRSGQVRSGQVRSRGQARSGEIIRSSCISH